jgi:cytochrome c peroxidase
MGRRSPPPWPLLVVLGTVLGCADDGGRKDVPSTDEQAADWSWELPVGLPEPPVPEDNPMTAAKVELGRHLFYEPRLSVNEASSCGSCHRPSLSFTDGAAQAEGTTGELHRRSSMSLVNVAYNTSYTWANDLLLDLEHQALGPLFGTEPVELGLADLDDDRLLEFSEDPLYQDLFTTAYPERADPFTLDVLVQALAAFQRTILVGDSDYDRYLAGDLGALSDAAKDGAALFNSERLECYHCHGGFNFTDAAASAETPFIEMAFHNNGLYNVDGEGAYPAGDQGLIELTGDPRDMGAFKAPSLRNAPLTAPYMHDGSIADLDGVLDHYAAGGRTVSEGDAAGVGADSPLKSPFLIGFELTEGERAAMHAFFAAISNEDALLDERFADPFGNID